MIKLAKLSDYDNKVVVEVTLVATGIIMAIYMTRACILLRNYVYTTDMYIGLNQLCQHKGLSRMESILVILWIIFS